MAMSSTTSEAELPPGWMRWLLPSVSDLFFVALFGVLVFTALSVRLLGDAGIGWHIRTGQIIWQTNAVPQVDPFSSANSQPWFAWEWLYDLIVGRLESAAGLNGVVLFTAAVIAATFSLTFRMLLRRGTNVMVAAALVLLASSAAMIHFLARPHVLSWLFTMVWIWILQPPGANRSEDSAGVSDRRPVIWALWFLPLLMLVWVNVHGGFLVGFVLLGIECIDSLWRWFASAEGDFEKVMDHMRTVQRLRALSWAGLLSAVATLINPYGYHLHVHIYRYLTNRFLMDRINEFQSPNFHYVAQKCFAVLLLLTLIGLASRQRGPQRLSVRDGLILLFAVYSGLYASRNIPVSALLLIVIMGPQLSDATASFRQSQWSFARDLSQRLWRFLRRMKAIEFALRGHLWPLAALAFAVVIAASDGKLGSNLVMNAHFDSKRFPAAAVNYLQSKEIRGSIFSPDEWGGYLIYRMFPSVKVVVDDRHDMYGEDFLRSYLAMMNGELGWKSFLQQHHADSLVVPKGSTIANLLAANNTAWRVVYSDEVAQVFVRVDDSGKSN